jgi:hypothetical protein
MTQETRVVSAGNPLRSAPASLSPNRLRFRASGVTFIKTLVSDYQILSPVQSFACTLVQQSSQYKPMTLSGRLSCDFCLIRAYRQQTSTYFDFFSWCSKSDAFLIRL